MALFAHSTIALPSTSSTRAVTPAAASALRISSASFVPRSIPPLDRLTQARTSQAGFIAAL
jgi:hypothetical protein